MICDHLGMTPDLEMPAAEVILQPCIRPFRMAPLLVTLRLAGREFYLLAMTRIVVDQRHLPQAAAVSPQGLLLLPRSQSRASSRRSCARGSCPVAAQSFPGFPSGISSFCGRPRFFVTAGCVSGAATFRAAFSRAVPSRLSARVRAQRRPHQRRMGAFRQAVRRKFGKGPPEARFGR
jgi:hypothetical protein